MCVCVCVRVCTYLVLVDGLACVWGVCAYITYLVLGGGACVCEEIRSSQRSEGDGGDGHH